MKDIAASAATHGSSPARRLRPDRATEVEQDHDPRTLRRRRGSSSRASGRRSSRRRRPRRCATRRGRGRGRPNRRATPRRPRRGRRPSWWPEHHTSAPSDHHPGGDQRSDGVVGAEVVDHVARRQLVERRFDLHDRRQHADGGRRSRQHGEQEQRSETEPRSRRPATGGRAGSPMPREGRWRPPRLAGVDDGNVGRLDDDQLRRRRVPRAGRCLARQRRGGRRHRPRRLVEGAPAHDGHFTRDVGDPAQRRAALHAELLPGVHLGAARLTAHAPRIRPAALCARR